MAINQPDAQGTFAPPAANELVDPAEQRFYAPEVLVVFPVFTFVFGFIAVSVLSAAGPRPVGIGFLAVAVLAALGGLRVPYVAIARPDGSLSFKAVTRTVTTSLSHVVQIARRSGGRGGTTWIFSFDGTRAQLNNRGGRMLAGYVVDHNPRVGYPPSLDRGLLRPEQ
jgi:hypothetical protein